MKRMRRVCSIVLGTTMLFGNVGYSAIVGKKAK